MKPAAVEDIKHVNACRHAKNEQKNMRAEMNCLLKRRTRIRCT